MRKLINPKEVIVGKDYLTLFGRQVRVVKKSLGGAVKVMVYAMGQELWLSSYPLWEE